MIDVSGNNSNNFGGVGAALFFALPILLLLGVGAGFLATSTSKSSMSCDSIFQRSKFLQQFNRIATLSWRCEL